MVMIAVLAVFVIVLLNSLSKGAASATTAAAASAAAAKSIRNTTTLASYAPYSNDTTTPAPIKPSGSAPVSIFTPYGTGVKPLVQLVSNNRSTGVCIFVTGNGASEVVGVGIDGGILFHLYGADDGQHTVNYPAGGILDHINAISVGGITSYQVYFPTQDESIGSELAAPPITNPLSGIDLTYPAGDPGYNLSTPTRSGSTDPSNSWYD